MMEIWKDEDIIVRKEHGDPNSDMPYNHYVVGFANMKGIHSIVEHTLEAALCTAISMQKDMFYSAKVYCEIQYENF